MRAEGPGLRSRHVYRRRATKQALNPQKRHPQKRRFDQITRGQDVAPISTVVYIVIVVYVVGLRDQGGSHGWNT